MHYYVKILYVLSCTVLLNLIGQAQKKLVILGSSTSACAGPSVPESCYVARLQQYYQTSGMPVAITNLAVGGTTVYRAMPSSYVAPAYRETPDIGHNITAALATNPDVILVNFPSNGYDIFSVAEVMFCLRTIKQVANNAGKPCYITTSQPRSEPPSFSTSETRRKMAAIKDSVLNEFGSFGINFWDGIVNPVDSTALSIYSAGDGIHLNNAAHGILAQRVEQKDMFNQQPGTANALKYRYYEGNWNGLPNFDALIPLKTGTVSNVDLGIRNVNDDFAVVWEGYINIPSAGNYAFETVSDDGSKLYFNSMYSPGAVALVNNDGLHAPQSASGTVYIPSAGVYPITMTFFQKSAGEIMQVYWTRPGMARELIPATAFVDKPQQPANGLRYRYYEGNWNALPDFSVLTPVKTGSTPNIDIAARNVNDNFGFVWEGTINIPTAGTYSFETISDDGSKLYFNSLYSGGAVALVNNDGLHSAQSASATVTIPAPGPYPIAITFFEKGGGESIQVFWAGPGIPRQLIPNSAFADISVTPIPSTGLRFKYYEGAFSYLPDFNTLAPVKTGTTPNVDLNIRAAGVNDNFACLWEGFINIPTPGNYTFETISDDGSKVYFNSSYDPLATALVNNDGLHSSRSASGTVYVPSAGSYPITITFFELGGGESLQLYYSGPGIARQTVPNSAFTNVPPPTASGLKYKYYEGMWSYLPNFNLLTAIKTGSAPNIDLNVRPAGVNDNFGLLWEGFINIPTAGNYTFETISDDGSNLYFNSAYSSTATPLVNNDGLHATRVATASTYVPAPGLYPIAITFFERGGGESMQVYWTGPGISRQLIPNSAFVQNMNTLPANGVTPLAVKNENGENIINENGEIVTAYPNPFTERFNIKWNNKFFSQKVSVGIYDLSGRSLQNFYFSGLSPGNNLLKINMSSHPKLKDGIYLVKLMANGVTQQVFKVVKTGR